MLLLPLLLLLLLLLLLMFLLRQTRMPFETKTIAHHSQREQLPHHHV